LRGMLLGGEECGIKNGANGGEFGLVWDQLTLWPRVTPLGPIRVSTKDPSQSTAGFQVLCPRVARST
jgi:hypothetical protein